MINNLNPLRWIFRRCLGVKQQRFSFHIGQDIEKISGANYYFVFSYTLKQDTPWAAKGHELANASFVLPGKEKIAKGTC